MLIEIVLYMNSYSPTQGTSVTEVFILLLNTLRSMNKTKACKSEAILEDINCFLVFVRQFKGTATYLHNNMYSSDLIELGTCLTGLGGRFNQCVYTYEFSDNEMLSMCITIHIEMWNVFFFALRLWGSMSQVKQSAIKCDNESVVSVVNTGVIKDSGLVEMVLKYQLNVFILSAMETPNSKIPAIGFKIRKKYEKSNIMSLGLECLMHHQSRTVGLYLLVM